VIARRRRAHTAYEPDELRVRLHQRLDEAVTRRATPTHRGK
jgi:hypothetical protein